MTTFEKFKKAIIENADFDNGVTFFCGGYGDFDSLCLNILKEIKGDFPAIELLFITPYLNDNYSKLETAKLYYDGIIYPPLENVPRQFCISKRNEWMVNEADFLIAFVKYSWGGAAKTLEYAKRKKVGFFNLAELH